MQASRSSSLRLFPRKVPLGTAVFFCFYQQKYVRFSYVNPSLSLLRFAELNM